MVLEIKPAINVEI